MTRFVRIYHDHPDDTGAFVIADENVLPEKTHDPDCIRVQTLATVELGNGLARWLRDTLVELCKHLDEEERVGVKLRVTECPHGPMPRSAGAGHWRDWHRGHGCHLDPDVSSKKGTP